MIIWSPITMFSPSQRLLEKQLFPKPKEVKKVEKIEEVKQEDQIFKNHWANKLIN